MNKLFILMLLTAMSFGCNNKPASIVKEKDFQLLLKNHTVNKELLQIETDLTFWGARLLKNKTDFSAQSRLAALYNKRFQYSGHIEDVIKSDSFYLTANKIQRNFSSGIYKSLAANCITKHQFKEADLLLDTAAKMGDDLYATRLQQFDAALELGQYKRAESILNSIQYKNSFDYFFRMSKLQDHKGNFKESMSFMESAFNKAIETKNEHLILWVTTNLADMYGHHNRIQEAYDLYMSVLQKNPNYYHAWKGIAWIAFSHDHNTIAAKEILNWLQINHPVPDYHLMQAEIATYENDLTAKNKYTQLFIDEVTKPVYGNMYNKYLFALLSNDKTDINAALHIAKTEIFNRPTPQSYEFLAWALFKNGEITEANKIAKGRVMEKTFEPDALYRMGILLKSSGEKKLAKKYLTDALESSFELGPVVTAEIKQELKTL
jgi:tetratricopeptide (TPR) repeat protein